MISQDAICGECGMKYSRHHDFRDVKFCPYVDSGTFSSTPKMEAVGWLLYHNHREIYDQIVIEWQKENGHSV